MKERLTGALILVALFVIVVPEMLSGPSWRRAEGTAPTADGPPVRSYTMELGSDQADQSALAPQTAARAAGEPAAAENAPATPAPIPAPTSSESTVTPRPASEAVPRPAAPAVSPVPVPAATTPAAPVPAPPARVAAPALAPTASVSTPAWWVQAGSFSQSANAQRVVRELAAAGISARVSSVKSNGKELFRVRAGPVADRAAAEALRQRMAAAGHKGTLVPP